MSQFLLFEGGIGYALFKRQNLDEIEINENNVQDSIVDLARFSRLVRLEGFRKWRSHEEWLENVNCISLGEVSQALLQFLEHGLRPLTASIGGISIATTIYAIPEDFVDDQQDPELDARLTRAADEAARVARAATE